MRDDHHDDFEELLRSTRRRSTARNREQLRRSWGLALLAPLAVVLGALAMYGDWEPFDRRKPADADRDDVASFRASPLSSNPAALPVLVQRDIEQLVEADVTPRGPAPSKHELATLRTERDVTLLRAYAVLRYDEAGPLLEDVVDTATDERVRAEAVTMLGYVGYPSWRLLDELVDARNSGEDVTTQVKALRYFFSSSSETPEWIRDAVRELLAVAETCPKPACRRLAAGAIARAIRTTLELDWIDEVEQLARSDDAECREHAIDSVRGATAVLNPDRALRLLERALASDRDSEARYAASRIASPLLREALTVDRLRSLSPALQSLACDTAREPDLRSSALRALRFIGDAQALEHVARECASVRREARTQARRIGGPSPVESEQLAGAAPSDVRPLRAMLKKILEDRRNTSRSGADVVQGGRRAYAADPLRQIGREIRREILR